MKPSERINQIFKGKVEYSTAELLQSVIQYLDEQSGTFDEGPHEDIDYRKLLLSFIASLGICDHMGDVESDVSYVLKAMKIDIEWSELSDLMVKIAKRYNVKSVVGTDLTGDD